MKYIILQSEPNEKGTPLMYFPVIFTKNLIHKDVAEALINMAKDKYKTNLTVLSAGDYDLVSGTASGKSETLNISSTEEDTDLIARVEYFPFKF